MKDLIFSIYRDYLVKPFAGRGWASKLGLKKLHEAVWRRLLPGKPVEFRGGRFFFSPDDPGIATMLYRDHYEDFELETFLGSLEPGMNVLDVGANLV